MWFVHRISEDEESRRQSVMAYVLKYSALLVLRALNTTSEFKMASNKAVAGLFGDLILRHVDKTYLFEICDKSVSYRDLYLFVESFQSMRDRHCKGHCFTSDWEELRFVIYTEKEVEFPCVSCSVNFLNTSHESDSLAIDVDSLGNIIEKLKSEQKDDHCIKDVELVKEALSTLVVLRGQVSYHSLNSLIDKEFDRFSMKMENAFCRKLVLLEFMDRLEKWWTRSSSPLTHEDSKRHLQQATSKLVTTCILTNGTINKLHDNIVVIVCGDNSTKGVMVLLNSVLQSHAPLCFHLKEFLQFQNDIQAYVQEEKLSMVVVECEDGLGNVAGQLLDVLEKYEVKCIVVVPREDHVKVVELNSRCETLCLFAPQNPMTRAAGVPEDVEKITSQVAGLTIGDSGHYRKAGRVANLQSRLREIEQEKKEIENELQVEDTDKFVERLRGHTSCLALFRNVKAAGLFGDIVLRLHGQIRNLFLCVRHRSNDETKIYLSQLLKLRGDFSLLAYYKLYCKMEQLQHRDVELRRFDGLGDSMFVVHTTAKLSEFLGTIVDNAEWLQVLGSEGTCFRFTRDSDPVIYNLFDQLPKYKEMVASAIESGQYQQVLEIYQKLRMTQVKMLKEKHVVKLLEELEFLEELPDLLSHYAKFLSQLCFYVVHEQV